MARVMGLDYGSKRVGVSLTDEDGRVAFPKAVLPNDKFLISELKKLIASSAVVEVVIGESKDNSGTENAIARSARALGGTLEREAGVTMHYEPEFWSSQEVRAHTGARHVDAEAAAVILNSFLTKRHGNNN
jgi:putative holliday junction resolvase